MAVSTITYTNKVDLNTTSVADINKVNASDLNEIKTVVNNNSNELLGIQTYSTTEINTGKIWVDGKPIYRKVFMFGEMPNATTKDINHNISDLDKTIKIYGMAFRSSDKRALTIPDCSPGAEISCSVTNTLIFITDVTDRSSFNDGYIIIEYTKTTD